MEYLRLILSYVPLFWLDVSALCFAVLPGIFTLLGGKKKYIVLFSLIVFSLFCGAWAAHPQGGLEYALSGGIVFSCLLLFFATLSDFILRKIRRGNRKHERKERAEAQVSPRKTEEGNPFIVAEPKGDASLMKGDLQLEHALRVLEKLSGKKLSVADRLETDVIRNTINIYRYKDVLSPDETRTINNYLGTILKMMSKYSV